MIVDIVAWNPINDEYGNVKASLYIKPTLSLLEFINRNVSNGNRTMMVRVLKTGNAIYDGAPFFAIVDKSSDVPNCRQNFYQSTGLYTVTLSVNWFGYPLKKGKIMFMEGILEDTYGRSDDQLMKTQIQSESNTPVVKNAPSSIVNKMVTEPYKNDRNDIDDIDIGKNIDEEIDIDGVKTYQSNKNKNFKGKTLAMIVLTILIIFVILLLVNVVTEVQKE